jgi:alkyl hydroperoxide reductase subunit AhpC
MTMTRTLIGTPAPALEADALLPGGSFARLGLPAKGRWTALVFYPLDFTFVCPTELRAIEQRLAEFRRLDVDVLGVSVDSVHAHKAWTEGSLGPLSFPLVSDLKKELSRAYGVLHEEQSVSLRATVIVDPDGIVRSIAANDLSVGRSIDELVRTIEAFQTGELCPAGWTRGSKTLGKVA